VAGRWTVGAIAELHTGTPLSVIDAVNNTGSFSSQSDRRPRSAGWLEHSKRVVQHLAFVQNAACTFGDAPRDFASGPGTA